MFGPTQSDIAKALGLSQPTVALALNSKHQHKLLPETVAQIQAKAKKLGYRPQKLAQVLRSGRSHTIGVIFHSRRYHAPQERVKFLAQQAILAGYQLVAVDLDWFGANMEAVQDYLLGAAVEGVVMCNLLEETTEKLGSFFRERSIPIFSFSSAVDLSWDDAHADMKAAFYDMTRHHLAQGSRKLTLLLPFHDADYKGDPAVSIYLKAMGFIEAILSVGGVLVADKEASAYLNLKESSPAAEAKITGEIICRVRNETHLNAFEYGRVILEQMILDDNHPESLICSNDEIAAGAFSACHQYGTHVPNTMRVSGADDAPFSGYCGVPLTTIRQPSEAMAQWCIRRVVDLIEKPAERRTPKRRVFQCQLVIRKSSESSQSDVKHRALSSRSKAAGKPFPQPKRTTKTS